MVPKSEKDQVGGQVGSTLLLHVMGEVVVHTFGGVNHFELGGDEEAEKIIVREAAIVGIGIGVFE